MNILTAKKIIKEIPSDIKNQLNFEIISNRLTIKILNSTKTIIFSFLANEMIVCFKGFDKKILDAVYHSTSGTQLEYNFRSELKKIIKLIDIKKE